MYLVAADAVPGMVIATLVAAAKTQSMPAQGARADGPAGSRGVAGRDGAASSATVT